jgi:hypothetical protein
MSLTGEWFQGGAVRIYECGLGKTRPKEDQELQRRPL